MSVEQALIPAPFDEGDYLMSKIRHRCDDDGGCWVWKGSAQKGVMPIIHIGSNVMATRRAVWIAFNGEIEPGLEIIRKCETVLCVNPEHLKVVSKAVRRKTLARVRNKQRSVSAIARNRELHGKLDLEKVRIIRLNDERSDVLAERFGVSKTTINNVRAFRAWPELSNPFAGLGAR
jgi:hypothetical protein